MLVEKIEVGFDLSDFGGPFLTLDDPVKGKLDDPAWPLGGPIFYDITDDVRSIQLSRGKTQEFDSFNSGECVVELNNRLRWYDPTYEAGPYYGQIVPKRPMRMSTNGIVQYVGVIDDWNLEYTSEGEAIATFVTSDGFSYLNNQTLSAGTATSQLSGARVNAILSDVNVQWPVADRLIDAGDKVMGADVIDANTNVLSYLQLVEQSEGGRFFVGKSGDMVFKDSSIVPSLDSIVELSDNGTGIPYSNMTVVYGSEKLFNEVVLSSVITTTEVTAQDTDSIDQYGILNLTQTDLLIESDSVLTSYALRLVGQYSRPEFRFDAVDVRLNDLTELEQASLLNLEIGDIVRVVFTPSNLPPAIEKYAEIIRIDHEVDIAGEHIINFGFSTVDTIGWLLGTEAFGRLDFINIV